MAAMTKADEDDPQRSKKSTLGYHLISLQN